MGPFIEVVGMVRNAKYGIVSNEPESYFYIPLAQDFTFRRILQIRTFVPPGSLAASVTGEISRLAPSLNIIDLRTMKESLQGALGFFVFRLAATFASVIGGVGLILAVIGVYGVVSDACPRGEAAGTLYVIEPDLAELTADSTTEEQQDRVEADSVNPLNVLRLATVMGPLKKVLLVGCEPETLGPDEGQIGLSATVEAAIDEAVKMIESIVSNIVRNVVGGDQGGGTNAGQTMSNQ